MLEKLLSLVIEVKKTEKKFSKFVEKFNEDYTNIYFNEINDAINPLFSSLLSKTDTEYLLDFLYSYWSKKNQFLDHSLLKEKDSKLYNKLLISWNHWTVYKIPKEEEKIKYKDYYINFENDSKKIVDFLINKQWIKIKEDKK